MSEKRKVRFAVVGLGHIAQIAVLPAFAHATENCELTALISDDQEKLDKLSKKYGVKNTWTYQHFDEAVRSGQFDAVYIALPNDLHAEYTCRAARAGIHVLCEKPMAMTVTEAQKMIDCASEHMVKLMVAYRLHFEKTNMTAVQKIEEGTIGDVKLFNSTFSMQVREGNIRTKSQHGGGPLLDIGIYCLNAARYIMKAEPVSVTALTTTGCNDEEGRFAQVEESLGAVLRFPNERLATFICSFGASDYGRFEVVGTKGSLSLDPAFEYADRLKMTLKSDGSESTMSTPRGDQFAPELVHFADCIIQDRAPNPCGLEGLADMRVIEALKESVRTRQTIQLTAEIEPDRPSAHLIQEKPRVLKPSLVKVEAGSK